jgi:large subunit ribosomal protein L7/L12
MSLVTELADRMAALKPEEARELRLWFKDEYGIEPVGGDTPTQPQPEQSQPEAPKEPTEFDVVYAGFDPAKKINLIKVVREITGVSLNEAKLLVEGPEKTIRAGVGKDVAADLQKRLEEVGGKVVVKAAE